MRKASRYLLGLMSLTLLLTAVPIYAEEPALDQETESVSVEAFTEQDSEIGLEEPVEELQESQEPISICYQSHVQNDGWQPLVSDGAMSGTSGRGLRLEGIRITLENQPYEGSVQYRTHIQNIGWQSFVSNGAMSGTSGQSLRLEAIQIQLDGELAEHYSVYYRVHAQDIGWLGWARDGQIAGTTAMAKRLEAIEIRMVSKDDSNADVPVEGNSWVTAPEVVYQTHVQDLGWQNRVSNGATSGTTGKSKRLEGIQINLNNCMFSGDLQYRTHIQNLGWEKEWKNAGEVSGTTGKALRLEAIQIRLSGELAKYFDVYYRVHAQNFGWMGWSRNGQSAGTEGYAYRLEGIQIKLVSRGNSSPGSMMNSFRKYSIRDQYVQASAVLDQIGWNLHTAFNWIASNPYRVNNNWNNSANSRAHANAYFTHNAGDCYDMAAAFYEFAKVMGYNAHQIAGYVPLASGGLGPHSWVEIDMNGSTYVFDPDFQHDTGKNGYMIYYRQSGTWMYSNYYRMN